jgi:hypothetical protein
LVYIIGPNIVQSIHAGKFNMYKERFENLSRVAQKVTSSLDGLPVDVRPRGAALYSASTLCGVQRSNQLSTLQAGAKNH